MSINIQNKAKEVDYDTLIEEIKKDKEIKVAVLKDILKYDTISN